MPMRNNGIGDVHMQLDCKLPITEKLIRLEFEWLVPGGGLYRRCLCVDAVAAVAVALVTGWRPIRDAGECRLLTQATGVEGVIGWPTDLKRGTVFHLG
jgi:hypothetical protein